jgi:hypothetical protein
MHVTDRDGVAVAPWCAAYVNMYGCIMRGAATCRPFLLTAGACTPLSCQMILWTRVQALTCTSRSCSSFL